MPQPKQTTAMKELKEKLQVVVDDMKPVTNWDIGYRTAMQNVIKDIDAQMLDKERSQDIEDAWNNGFDMNTTDSAEDYFTNTFKQ